MMSLFSKLIVRSGTFTEMTEVDLILLLLGLFCIFGLPSLSLSIEFCFSNLMTAFDTFRFSLLLLMSFSTAMSALRSCRADFFALLPSDF